MRALLRGRSRDVTQHFTTFARASNLDLSRSRGPLVRDALEKSIKRSDRAGASKSQT